MGAVAATAHPAGQASVRHLASIRGLPAGESPRRHGPPPSRPVAGGGLADAVKSINEGAELLAEARRNGV